MGPRDANRIEVAPHLRPMGLLLSLAPEKEKKKKEPRASEKRSSGRHKKPRPIGFPTAGLRAIQALRLWGPVREALGPPRRCSLVPGPKQEGRRQSSENVRRVVRDSPDRSEHNQSRPPRSPASVPLSSRAQSTRRAAPLKHGSSSLTLSPADAFVALGSGRSEGLRPCWAGCVKRKSRRRKSGVESRKS